MLNNLTIDSLISILLWLDPNSLFRFFRINKFIQRFKHHPKFWSAKISFDFPTYKGNMDFFAYSKLVQDKFVLFDFNVKIINGIRKFVLYRQAIYYLDIYDNLYLYLENFIEDLPLFPTYREFESISYPAKIKLKSDVRDFNIIRKNIFMVLGYDNIVSDSVEDIGHVVACGLNSPNNSIQSFYISSDLELYINSTNNPTIDTNVTKAILASNKLYYIKNQSLYVYEDHSEIILNNVLDIRTIANSLIVKTLKNEYIFENNLPLEKYIELNFLLLHIAKKYPKIKLLDFCLDYYLIELF